MVKRISLSLVLLLFCSELVWAQRAKVAQEDDRTARRQWEEDQRADEFATSLRRRDWLKDRLLLELGMGTKFPAMGRDWFGFGAGVEYITQWHFAASLSGGFILAREDDIFPNDPKHTFDGGMGWRFGLAYYMFPKSPVHIGLHVSYGTVFFDHQTSFDKDYTVESEIPYPIITCIGYEFDLSVSYLSDQWYFLQAMIGVYTIGNGQKATGKRDSHWDSWGRSNPSWKYDPEKSKYVSLVTTVGGNEDEAIPPVGLVFGISVGFAFEEFFPDDTEIRRREREDARSKQSQFRSAPATKRATPAPKRSNRVVEEDYDED